MPGTNKKKIEVRGIWNDKREEADFIVKGTPTYIDDKHKSFQGPVVDGKAKYARVLIRRKKMKDFSTFPLFLIQKECIIIVRDGCSPIMS